jgi:hypothetical protein
MATNFRQSGSILGAGILLLTVFGCSADATSEEQAAELDTKTQALDMFCAALCEDSYWDFSLSCETSDLPGRGGNGPCYQYADMLLAQCLDTCWEPEWPELPEPSPPPPQFAPDQRCTDPQWLPVPTATPPQNSDWCQSDVLMACHGRCDLCNYPTTQDRGACNTNCRSEWCTPGAPTTCMWDNRTLWCDERDCRGLTGEQLYTCLGRCLIGCHGDR